MNYLDYFNDTLSPQQELFHGTPARNVDSVLKEAIDIPNDLHKQACTFSIPSEGILSIGVVGGNLYHEGGPWKILPMPDSWFLGDAISARASLFEWLALGLTPYQHKTFLRVSARIQIDNPDINSDAGHDCHGCYSIDCFRDP